jgi:hypothetical protein
MNSQRNGSSQYTLPRIALPTFSDESSTIPMARLTACESRTVSRQNQSKPEAPPGRNSRRILAIGDGMYRV